MTREEALNILYNASVYHPDYLDAFNMAIKALEQEPCEDAVSRQAILDIIEKEEFKGDALSEIEKLLPVNLQKIGHWIADVDKWGDVVTTVNGYRCDKCNTFNADKDNYCPNCGAKMFEPQERSDKE